MKNPFCERAWLGKVEPDFSGIPLDLLIEYKTPNPHEGVGKRGVRSMRKQTRNLEKGLRPPDFVKTVLGRLHRRGHEAYIVGGAVRDVCMNQHVTDWDITTSAPPEAIESVFHDIKRFSLKHETVTLVEQSRHYEVTCFRGQDGRGETIEEDLSHRDFTINAMAYDMATKRIIDPYGGRKDILRGLIRAVGNPEDRFREDPLRIMRAVRMATEIGFKIEPKTLKAIRRMAKQLRGIAAERIRDELVKILLSKKPSRGLELLQESGLLGTFLPELLEGYRKRQNHDTVYRHILKTIDHVEPKPALRLAALFHDIAKPRHREKTKGEFRFPGHEAAGAGMAQEIMLRLKFSRGMIHEVAHLVLHHVPVTSYDVPWSDEALRRLVRRLEPEHIQDFFSFSRADLLAHGRPSRRVRILSDLERSAYRIIKKPLALETRQLAIDGKKVMEIFALPPGPKVGKILEFLMERVTDHPEMNTEKKLIAMLEEMNVGERNSLKRGEAERSSNGTKWSALQAKRSQ
jgi:tRNA nucleotidyltransferase (CCA-adding enzyme)